MSAHSFLQIGDRLLYAARESYVPDVVALFREDELLDDGERYRYQAPLQVVADRLQLSGFTPERARHELETAVAIWHSRRPSPVVDEPRRDAADLVEELRLFLNSTDEFAEFHEPEEVWWQLDPRTIFRLALDVVADRNSHVGYNFDDLASWQLVDRGRPVADEARETRRQGVARDAPLVVLTEGSSDSQLLRDGMRVTHPHLDGFFRFIDFGTGAEGGVAALARLVRSFVGAGIANRVLALADNDTAAHDALKSLKRTTLPDGYRIQHYPHLPILDRYPTLGPQHPDPVLMDVNGRAGSLEMYFGRDLLTVDGDLLPVQWIGYVESQRAYQGSLAPHEKRRLHGAFKKKVQIALQDPAERKRQDWSGITAIVDTILHAFD